MLVSHTKKFIYLKGFKVGGTSTEMFFQPACQPPEAPITHLTDENASPFGIVGERRAFAPDETKPQFFNHITMKELRDILGPEVWKSYFKFSTIRNPFDAVLSAAEQLAAGKRVTVTDDSMFNEFLDQVLDGLATTPLNVERFCFVDGIMELDDVVRFENLERDALRIAKRLDVTPQSDFPHMKKRDRYSRGRKVTDFIDQRRADIVTSNVGTYFEHFNYSTDPANA
jgi:hypothetical protein